MNNFTRLRRSPALPPLQAAAESTLPPSCLGARRFRNGEDAEFRNGCTSGDSAATADRSQLETLLELQETHFNDESLAQSNAIAPVILWVRPTGRGHEGGSQMMEEPLLLAGPARSVLAASKCGPY